MWNPNLATRIVAHLGVFNAFGIRAGTYGRGLRNWITRKQREARNG